jgi:uncharacterized protein YxjI
MADWLSEDRFVIDQLIRPMANLYRISAGPTPVAFVRQKKMAIKEDIRFYADESKAQEILRIKARQRFDPRARYDVTDPMETKVGEIQKVFGASLLRSTYALFDERGEETARAREKNLVVALFRRVVGFVPYVGGFADWLPIPYHFEFRRGDEVLGTHSRQAFKFRDTYTIDMSGDPQRTIDRRMILAIAVGMDALQAR